MSSIWSLEKMWCVSVCRIMERTGNSSKAIYPLHSPPNFTRSLKPVNMFNPFYPFTTDLLEALVGSGKRFFVRQRFERARIPSDQGIRGYFLVSHYELLTTAQDHLGAIAYDP